MKRIVCFMFLCVFLTATAEAAEVTAGDIAKTLPAKLQHPYLFFSENDKPAIIDRIKRDTESRDIMARLKAETNRLLYTPVQDPPVMDKNPRFTGDWGYNRYMFDCAGSAFKLAFVYQMTGDERYAHKAFEFADAVCDLKTWTDRAHQFPIIYSRVMPWNVPDDQVVFSYDIYAAEIATDLAAVYDWLYPALDKPQRDRIRGALFENAILRVRGNWDYHWWAWAYRCNWLTTCASGVGMASLALLTENPELTDVVAESFNRIWRTFDEIGADGGWQEGVGYSSANHYWAVVYGDPLKRLTGGKYTLLNHPKIREHPVSFYLYTILPPDYAANFGDSGYDLRKENVTFVFNKLADETGSGETAWYRNTMLGEGEVIYDLIWPRTTVKPSLPAVGSRHFRSIDFAVMRSDFTDTDKVVLACKSGKNDDPHHGHLDIGSFILQWRGQAFVRDIGSIPYDQQCFDDARWNYIEASSAGHNVVFVNGELQIPGKWRGKPMDETIGGRIVEFRTSPDRDYVIMDPTDAYPKKELKNWRRHITLEKPVITVILDEVVSRKGAEIEARFFSASRETIRDGYVLLEGERGTMALVTAAGVDISFRPGKLMNLPVKVDARLKEEPYIGAVMKAEGDNTVFTTLIVPVEGDSEAQNVAASVELKTVPSDGKTLTFSYRGKPYSYRYIQGEDGLVLEK